MERSGGSRGGDLQVAGYGDFDGWEAVAREPLSGSNAQRSTLNAQRSMKDGDTAL